MLVVIAFLVLLTAASACGTGARELDEWAYVFSIGVDKGVEDKYRYTFQFPTLTGTQKNSGGGTDGPKTEGSNDREEVTIDCPTLQAGINLVLSSYSRRMNFTHALYLIISEELARESVEPLINSMTRSSEIRRTMNVIIVKGKAMDFIHEFNPVAGASVAKSQEKFMQNADLSSFYENMRYNEFANRIKCTKCQATATMAALNDFSSFKEDGGRQEQEFISEGDYYAGEFRI
jgi:spore germination protein KC